jgi:hypothetical protein
VLIVQLQDEEAGRSDSIRFEVERLTPSRVG